MTNDRLRRFVERMERELAATLADAEVAATAFRMNGDNAKAMEMLVRVDLVKHRLNDARAALESAVTSPSNAPGKTVSEKR